MVDPKTATAQQLAESWVDRKLQGKRIIRSAEAVYGKPTLSQEAKFQEANRIYSKLIKEPATRRRLDVASERRGRELELKQEAKEQGFDDPREFAVRRGQLRESIQQSKIEKLRERQQLREKALSEAKQERSEQVEEGERRQILLGGGGTERVVEIERFRRGSGVTQPQFGMGRTDLKVKNPIVSAYETAEQGLSRTAPAQKLQRIGQANIVQGGVALSEAKQISDLLKSGVGTSTVRQVILQQAPLERGIRFAGGTQAFLGGGVSFIGEKPLTSASLVGLGFGGKVAGTALISKGGATAFTTKTALATVGGIAVGSEAIAIASQPTERSRFARAGETFAKFSLVGLGSKLADPIVRPLSKAELAKAEQIAKTGKGEQKGIVFDNDKRFSLQTKRAEGNLQVVQRARGKLFPAKGGFTALGKTQTSIKQFGITKAVTKVKPFSATLTPRGKGVGGESLLKVANLGKGKLSVASGETFTGSLRPSVKSFSLAKSQGRVTKFLRTKIEARAFSTPKDKFLITTADASGRIFTFRKGDPTKFFLLGKRGQVSLSAPKFKTSLPSPAPAEALSALSIQAPSSFIPTVSKGLPLFATGLRQRSGVSLAQQQRSGSTFIQSKALRSELGLVSTQSGAFSSAQASATTTITPTTTITTTTLSPVTTITPSQPFFPLRPKGFALPDFPEELPRRKKKKKKKKKGVAEETIVQGFTAKVLNLKPIKLKKLKTKKLKQSPVGIRRGVVR